MAKRRTRDTTEMTQSTPTTPTELPMPPEPGDSADRAQQSEGPAMGSEPSEEDIRLRAYHRFLHRGGQHGGHVDDWVEAERELRRRTSDE